MKKSVAITAFAWDRMNSDHDGPVLAGPRRWLVHGRRRAGWSRALTRRSCGGDGGLRRGFSGIPTSDSRYPAARPADGSPGLSTGCRPCGGRSEPLLRSIAELALKFGVPVVFRGSALSHAYYVLRRLGVSVHTPLDDRPFAYSSRQFGKLVRDRIPQQVLGRGEAVLATRGAGISLALRSWRPSVWFGI